MLASECRRSYGRELSPDVAEDLRSVGLDLLPGPGELLAAVHVDLDRADPRLGSRREDREPVAAAAAFLPADEATAATAWR